MSASIPASSALKARSWARVCLVGIPAAIQNLLNVTGMTILNNFTSSYGANAVAAMGIAQKINQVPFYIANGLSQGIMPLISYNYASDNIKRMKHTLTFAAKISVTGLVLVSIAYSFFAGDLITMFMDNPEIVEMGTRFLRGFCLGLPFLCVDFLAVGVFQASGSGTERPGLCHPAQDRPGDPRPVYS